MTKKFDSISRVKKQSVKSIPTKKMVHVSQKAEEAEKYETLFPEPTISLNSPPRWLFISLLIVLVLSLILFAYKVSNTQLNSWLSVSSPIPTSVSSPSPTIPTIVPPSESASPSPVATASSSPQPTPQPTPTSFNKSAISIRILNGTKRSGAAALAESTLKKQGFTIRDVGNARQQTYPTTIIYYQNGRLAEASAVKDSLPTYSSTLQESSLANPDMVLVVIGNE